MVTKMKRYPLFFFLGLLAFTTPAFSGLDFLCEKLKIEGCGSRNYNRGTNSTHPTESTAYKMNPSSIPTARGIGGEVITKSGHYDFGIVTGTGKVGAAVSPSSSEDTFFGNIAFEENNVYLTRKRDRKIFENKKTTLATALKVLGKQGSPFKLSVGLIGKSNERTQKKRVGGGASLQIGPAYVGYSIHGDDYQDTARNNAVAEYTIKAVTWGAKFPYVAFDYSKIQYEFESSLYSDAEIRLLSTTFFIKKFMLTWASRVETSDRLKFDFDTNTGTVEKEKRETFLGLQYAFNEKVIGGLFSNYYLLRGLSLGVTMFY